MKKLLLVTAGLLGAMTWAFPQVPFKVHTSPKLPERDALQRMNLVMAWNANVKVVGQRDGLYSVQVIPGNPNPQVVAQTYEGAVYLFDAENGDLIWKTKVGLPYWDPQPVGYNSQAIFVTRRSVLHVLSRYTGLQQAYTVDVKTRQVHFGYDMSFSPSAGLVADEDGLYVSMSNRVQAFEIPDYDYLLKAKLSREKRDRELNRKKEDKEAKEVEKGDEEVPMARPGELDSAQPEFNWGYLMAGETTEFPPLVADEQLSILTTNGNLISVSTYGRGPRNERYDFKTTGRVAAPAGQHGPMAYIGSDDFNLYAVNMRNFNLVWRHVSGAPILRKPEVNDRDVFIYPNRVGLRRIDRKTGREVWTNRDTTRFLAASPNYVYALDRAGTFFVLDEQRGTTLASYDMAAWAIPVPNDLTDRIYLAANDGQILCIKPRDSVKAIAMKTLGPKKEEKKPIEKKKEEPKKEEEKKEEKKKDDNQALREQAPALPRVDRFEACLESVVALYAADDRRSEAGR